MKKTLPEILLRILMAGGRVEHQGATYAMTEDNGLCIIAKDQQDNEIPLGVDCDLKAFCAMAESIGGDRLFLAGCSVALGEMRSARGQALPELLSSAYDPLHGGNSSNA
jgi:hypothetical protein